MALEGMDVELANTQAGQLQTTVIDQIQATIHSMSGLSEQIAQNWTGPDSSEFNSNWHSDLVAKLNAVLAAMTQFHTTFTQNIQEQTSTSQGGLGGAIGSSVAGVMGAVSNATGLKL